MTVWNVGFAGTSDTARDILDVLVAQQQLRVPLVITRPDRAKGRGLRSQSTPVGKYADDHGITVLRPQSPEQFAAIGQLDNLDLLLVVAYGMRIPEAALQRPRLRCVNVHYSLLPRWRGAAPVICALANGDKRTGVSLFVMQSELDSGPLLLQRDCAIEDDDTGGTLLHKLNTLARTVVPATLVKIFHGDVKPVTQDHAKATYAPRITTADTTIDWQRQSAVEIERLVRAMHPRPLARATVAGIPLLLHQVRVDTELRDALPGTILHTGDNSLGIAAADGRGIKLSTVQAPGRCPLPIAEFLNGRPELRHAQTAS